MFNCSIATWEELIDKDWLHSPLCHLKGATWFSIWWKEQHNGRSSNSSNRSNNSKNNTVTIVTTATPAKKKDWTWYIDKLHPWTQLSCECLKKTCPPHNSKTQSSNNILSEILVLSMFHVLLVANTLILSVTLKCFSASSSNNWISNQLPQQVNKFNTHLFPQGVHRTWWMHILALSYPSKATKDCGSSSWNKKFPNKKSSNQP